MAINEVAANIETRLMDYGTFEEWINAHPDSEVIDIKYSATEQDDMVLLITRKDDA